METHNFRLVLADAADIVDDMSQAKFVELANALYEAGCDDGSPEVCQSKVAVDFHRDAATLEDAIRSAINDVARAGYQVAGVERPERTP